MPCPRNRGESQATGSLKGRLDSVSKQLLEHEGHPDLAKLAAGDRVLVQARVCKADLAEGAVPALTAVRVVGHPAHPPKDAKDEDDND